ncbi:MAG: hypothetical protein HGA38_04645 [Candidatus Moranbacteria bacterium]|nr:hypothetical protein [Candidatus Moranbacteria bacterium]
MKNIPSAVQSIEIIRRFSEAGLPHVGSGKTGELFENPRYPDYLLMYRTDRVSIFDFVLPTPVPGKGSVLTAMPILWLLYGGISDVLKKFDGHHIAQFGSVVDDFLPNALHSDREIQTRTLVIRRFQKPQIESIVRGFLTGSGFDSYDRTGAVCGHNLPSGLHDGSRLPFPIYTPTTKADSGHDEHVDYLTTRKRYGIEPENLSIKLFEAASRYAETRNLLIADAKFELSGSTLIDEFLTPDTMRIWKTSDWKAAQTKNPPKAPGGYDKQYLREWGKSVSTPFRDDSGLPIVGVHRLDPENPEHIEFVSSLLVPEKVIAKTSDLYHELPELLFGISLDTFWRDQGKVAI